MNRSMAGLLSFIIITLLVLMMALLFGKNPHHGKPTPAPTATPTPVPTVTPIPIVTLAWDAVPDPSVLGYHLWLGFASGQEQQELATGTGLSWTVQLTSGTTYYFVVTAYSASGESLPSNEVQYRTP